jgi:hypothetical protein
MALFSPLPHIGAVSDPLIFKVHSSNIFLLPSNFIQIKASLAVQDLKIKTKKTKSREPVLQIWEDYPGSGFFPILDPGSQISDQTEKRGGKKYNLVVLHLFGSHLPFLGRCSSREC